MTRVLCHGCFEVLHIGHLLYLQQASAMGELYVSVTADSYVNKGKGRPIFNEEDRLNMICALSCVDAAFISDSPTAVDAILDCRPDIYAKGPDYEHGDSTGHLDLERAAVESYGGRLVIIKPPRTFSSTAILTGEMWQKKIREMENG